MVTRSGRNVMFHLRFARAGLGLAASLGLAFSTLLASGAPALAARPPQPSMVASACTIAEGPTLAMSVVWTGMPVVAWKWSVEATDGSGGVIQPLDNLTMSGNQRHTWGPVDP